jgi:hypothetical protein
MAMSGNPRRASRPNLSALCHRIAAAARLLEAGNYQQQQL